MLYQLIWRRFIASQMMPAIYDTVSADIAAGKEYHLACHRFDDQISRLFAVYEEKNDDEEKDDENRMLPNLEEGQPLDSDRIDIRASLYPPAASLYRGFSG